MNIRLPNPDGHYFFMAAEVNHYEPNTPVKCTKKSVFDQDGRSLCTSLTYDRSGMFLRAILIDYEYFSLYNFYRLGFVASSLLSPFGVTNPKIKSKYLALVWTDQLTEVEALYTNLKGSFQLIDDKRKALDQYQRIIRLLQWIRTEKVTHLKKVTSKALIPIFSEYVMNAGIPLDTLQSAFQENAKR